MNRRRGGELCPHCGMRYSAFRSEASWQSAYLELRAEHDRRIEESNDYSLPPRQRSILGRMHEQKRSWWEVHAEECERGCEEDPSLGDLAGYDLAEKTRRAWRRLRDAGGWVTSRRYTSEYGGEDLRSSIGILLREGLIERMFIGRRKPAYRAVTGRGARR